LLASCYHDAQGLLLKAVSMVSVARRPLAISKIICAVVRRHDMNIANLPNSGRAGCIDESSINHQQNLWDDKPKLEFNLAV